MTTPRAVEERLEVEGGPGRHEEHRVKAKPLASSFTRKLRWVIDDAVGERRRAPAAKDRISSSPGLRKATPIRDHRARTVSAARSCGARSPPPGANARRPDRKYGHTHPRNAQSRIAWPGPLPPKQQQERSPRRVPIEAERPDERRSATELAPSIETGMITPSEVAAETHQQRVSTRPAPPGLGRSATASAARPPAETAGAARGPPVEKAISRTARNSDARPTRLSTSIVVDIGPAEPEGRSRCRPRSEHHRGHLRPGEPEQEGAGRHQVTFTADAETRCLHGARRRLWRGRYVGPPESLVGRMAVKTP